MLDKKKMIFAGVGVVLMGSAMLIPQMLTPKPHKQAQEEEMSPVKSSALRKGEELTFEKAPTRAKSFEELSPQEREQLLYMQMQESIQMQESTMVLAQEIAQSTAQQAVDEAMRKQKQTQQNNPSIVSFPSATPPPVTQRWSQDEETLKLLDKDFSTATNYFRGQIDQGRWSMSSGQYQNVLQKSNNVVRAVNRENLELFDEKIITTETSHIIPSGTYLTAITTGFTDSDYPEYFVANMSRPSILRGWKILCKSGGNNAGRVSITPDRLISPEGKEVPISGQIEMGSIPGVTGDKHSRWFKRMAPSIINAGIGGGLLIWSMQEEEKNRNALSVAGGSPLAQPMLSPATTTTSTNTIIEPMIQDGIGGLQKEITRSFQQGNTDDQVKIYAGTVFDILLLSPLTIKQ